jgi:hypothetical protein
MNPTQWQRLLPILKSHSSTGISAGKLNAIRWMPQYGRVVSDLRDRGHLIVNVDERFHYCGEFGANGFQWHYPIYVYSDAVQKQAEMHIAQWMQGAGRYCPKGKRVEASIVPGRSIPRFTMD